MANWAEHSLDEYLTVKAVWITTWETCCQEPPGATRGLAAILVVPPARSDVSAGVGPAGVGARRRSRAVGPVVIWGE
jgi:hypothetical protein